MKKGLVLAGGFGTRLSPLTIATSKQLLPIYDKPVIFYPLKTLKDMGYLDILIIAGNKEQEDIYKKLLGDGSQHGLNLEYIIQDYPRGLADAFIIGEDFIGDADEICLILGDNIIINENPIVPEKNKIFTFAVKTPELYGVVTTNEDGTIDRLVEKPNEFLSENAVIGLYIFDNKVVEIAKKLEPSSRGELEIVDLILKINKIEPIKVEKLDGIWLDIGDVDSLLDCGNLVRTISKRTTRTIGL